MSTAGYGLFRGINEGYDAFRERESQIAAEEQAAKEQAYTEEMRAREAEQHKYGLEQRPFNEQKRDLEISGLQRQDRIQQADEDDLYSEKARADRLKAVEMDNQTKAISLQERQLALGTAGLNMTIAANKVDQEMLSQQYRDWARKVNTGEWGLDELKEAYNDDNIESNNVEDFKENSDGTIDVTYSSGQTDRFRDMRHVTQMLTENANPAFLENMLLKEQEHKFAVAEAYTDSQKVTTEDMQKRADKWTTKSQSHVKMLYGRMFPGGAVDFGEEGDSRVAGAVNAMINRIGRAYKYDLTVTTPAELADDLADMADQTINANPEVREQRAKEIFEAMGDADMKRFGLDVKPDSDTPDGEAIMKQLVADQAEADLKAFEAKAITSLFQTDEEGDLKPAPKKEEKTKEPSKVGLEDIAGEAASNQMVDDPEYGVSSVTGPAAAVAKGQEASKKAQQTVEKKGVFVAQEPDALSEKLALSPLKGRPNRKQIETRKSEIRAAYTKKFDGLTKAEKKDFVERYGDSLSKLQLAAAKKRIAGAVDVAKDNPKGIAVRTRG